VKNCWRTRNRTLAVEGEHVASRSVMKSETWSRVTTWTSMTPACVSAATSWSADSPYVLIVLGARLEAGAPPVGLEPTTRCLEGSPTHAPS
jgi:hypothetical protein